MTPWNAREIARRLAERDDVEPPEGLLETIKSQIPAELPALHAVRESDGTTAQAGPRMPHRRLWLMAASLAAVITGGLLGLRMVQRGMVTTAREQQPAGEALARPAQPTLPDVPAPPAAMKTAPSAAAGGAVALDEAKPEPEMAAQQAAKEKVEARRSDLKGLDRLADGRVQPSQVPQAASPPPPPARPPVPAPKPAAAPEEQITVMAERGPTSGVEGGVPGGVAGGVAGGVVGGTPGGIPAGEGSRDASRLRKKTRNGPSRDDAEARSQLKDFDSFESIDAGGNESGKQKKSDQPSGDVFFRSAGVNPFVDTEAERLSTFGLDVDTGSYTVARSYLKDGHLPPADAVRVEEFVNFFSYGDAPPPRGDFAVRAEGAPTPFTPRDALGAPGSASPYRLLRFNVRGREVRAENRKPAVLTFVVDVSGSMAQENRLGLVKQALAVLLDQLRPTDRVGLVIFGDRAEVLLEPTGDREAIRRAIGRLTTGGSTNTEDGLVRGYDVAGRSFRSGAINRVILCTDGVANVGHTGPESMLTRIGREARRGIELTALGFGFGNYNDALLEQLADKGDGRYAYVDDLDEARRVFVAELTGTLQTIAKDAKAQVDFNPAAVSRWRLLGYENRAIANEKFRDDTVAAGQIGAGHSVTALYEVKLKSAAAGRQKIATLHLRFRVADTGEMRETKLDVHAADLAPSWEKASPGLRLAAVVAELAEVLRGSSWAKAVDLDDLLRRAHEVAAEQADSPRGADVAELVRMVADAVHLKRQREK